MPTYDYVCDLCDHALEIYQSFKEKPKKKCPHCGKLALRRVISGGIGLVFKGSGFYVTDSRSTSASTKSASSNDATPSTKTADQKKSDSTPKKKDQSSGGTSSNTEAKPAKAA